MKTFAKFLFSAVLSGAAISYAGPGPQYWQNRPAAKPQPLRARTAPATPQADSSTLTCAYMTVPNTGQGFSKATMMTVRCTPEMMKNSTQCRQACAAQAKKG